MKRIVFMVVLFALIVTACGTEKSPAPTLAPTSAPLPVLVVDVEHMVKPTEVYVIPAGPGFVLDATGYDFGLPEGPNAIQVILDSHAFTGTWTSGAQTQIVRAEALLPPPGFKPLTGFPAGKQMIVAIGNISANNRFQPVWVASVDVK